MFTLFLIPYLLNIEENIFTTKMNPTDQRVKYYLSPRSLQGMLQENTRSQLRKVGSNIENSW